MALVNFPLTGSTGNFIAPGGVVSGNELRTGLYGCRSTIASATSTTICAGSNVYISLPVVTSMAPITDPYEGPVAVEHPATAYH